MLSLKSTSECLALAQIPTTPNRNFRTTLLIPTNELSRIINTTSWTWLSLTNLWPFYDQAAIFHKLRDRNELSSREDNKQMPNGARRW